MGDLTLQEYYQKMNIPTEDYGLRWATNLYLQSEKIEGSEFFAPENLLSLSDDAVQELQDELAETETLFEKNLNYLNRSGLAADNKENLGAIFAQDETNYPGIDIMTTSRTKEIFIEGGMSGEDALLQMQGEVDEFLNNATNNLTQSVELRGALSAMANSLAESGPEGLATYQGQINEMSPPVREHLMGEIEAAIDTRIEDPDEAASMKEIFEEHISPAVQEETAAPTPQAIIAPTVPV